MLRPDETCKGCAHVWDWMTVEGSEPEFFCSVRRHPDTEPGLLPITLGRPACLKFEGKNNEIK